MSDVSFLRPLWLGAIPLLALLWWWGLRRRPLSAWQRLIPPDMLRHLLVGEQRTLHGWHALLCGWLVAAVALAGPSWRQADVPVSRNRQAAVLVLDLSPSMRAADLEPDRVTRARFKIIDLLRLRGDGLTALVVYAGDAHTVVPLTDDARTIEALLPALAPETMPMPGANTEAAVALATQLLDSLGQQAGQIVLVTDGIAPAVRPALRKQLPERYRLSVLAVGTEAGAPISAPGGGFVTGAGGEVVLASVDHDELRQLAAEHRGRYAALATDDRDVRAITSLLDAARDDDSGQEDNRRLIAARIDGGYWLLVLLVPLAALGFRRGLLFALLLACVAPPSARAEAESKSAEFRWADLWLRPDQQAARALAADDPATAAQRFTSPDWAGYAAYRNQDYARAAEHLAAAGDPASRFNLGNALAQQDKLEEAAAAYQAALDQASGDEALAADARYNKDLVERLLRDRARQQSREEESGSGQNDQAAPSDGSGQSRQQSRDAAETEPGAAAPAGREGSAADAANAEARDAGERSDSSQDNPRTAAPSAAPQADAATANGQAADGSPEADAAATAATPGSVPDAPLAASSEQWLRAIPDDPAGLLRRKFSYETEAARRNQQGGRQQEQRY